MNPPGRRFLLVSLVAIVAGVIAAFVPPPTFIVDKLEGASGWARVGVAVIIWAAGMIFLSVAGVLTGEFTLPGGAGYKSQEESPSIDGLQVLAAANRTMAENVDSLSQVVLELLDRIDSLEMRADAIDVTTGSSESEEGTQHA